jgi:hypothetical protein
MMLTPGAVGWVILDSELDIEVVTKQVAAAKCSRPPGGTPRNCIPRRRLDSIARKLTFSIYQALLRGALEGTAVGI